MSSPDDPTRRIPPTNPPRQAAPAPPGREPPRGPVHERELVEEDPAARAHAVEQIRNFRAALAVVGLLAALALGLGIYLLATRDDDDDGNRNAASAGQVRALDKRIDELESRTGNRASKRDLNQVEQSQSQLAERLDTVEEQAGQDDSADLEQAIDDLSNDVQQLEQRIDEVEQEQEQQQQP